jgi:hypothetical protein
VFSSSLTISAIVGELTQTTFSFSTPSSESLCLVSLMAFTLSTLRSISFLKPTISCYSYACHGRQYPHGIRVSLQRKLSGSCDADVAFPLGLQRRLTKVTSIRYIRNI